MAKKNNTLLKPGELINEIIEVKKFVGEGAFAEVYRVNHKFLGSLAFKVLKPDAVSNNDIDFLMNEAKILRTLLHPNIIRIFDAGKFKVNSKELFYISSEFVSGESLMQLLQRRLMLNIDLAIKLQKDICSGLKHTHEQETPIVHRDIKPQNVLLCYDAEFPVAKIGDYGIAINMDNLTDKSRIAGTYIYMAPEVFWGCSLPSSDVFSAGLIFYQMIAGQPPWIYDFKSIDYNNSEEIENLIFRTRKKKPQKPSDLNEFCDKRIDNIVFKALEDKVDNRFKNGYEFLNALLEHEIAKSETTKVFVPNLSDSFIRIRERGKGFDEIAGMEELKQNLYNEVILPLEKRELFEKYRITVPNGILLYGPPGCGKTFICQKLAEEVKYNFISIKPSDIASVYVHGTQEKIAKLFGEAEDKSPTIMFIDEIDAVLPKRESNLSHHYSQEVNEFLTQLNNCSKRGILLIGTTNRPENIDNAVLRTGRFDKIIYIGPPDEKARIKLFELFLSDRPVDRKINFIELSQLTENYVSSDIEFIVNESSRDALLSNSLIMHNHLKNAILKIKPSLSLETLKKYEEFKIKRNN